MHLKIGDFGLALELPAEGGLVGPEHPGACPLDVSAIGSLYSAPELGSEGGYDQRVDNFSMGMTLFAIFAECHDQEQLTAEVEALKNSAKG